MDQLAERFQSKPQTPRRPAGTTLVRTTARRIQLPLQCSGYTTDKGYLKTTIFPSGHRQLGGDRISAPEKQ